MAATRATAATELKPEERELVPSGLLAREVGRTFDLGMLAKRRRMLRGLRALAFKALHVVAVLVLLTGIAQAGSRYFYCPLMNVVLSASCCDHEEKPGDVPELHQTDCCESKSNELLPAGAATTPAQAFVAPLIAILPPIEIAHAVSFFPPRREWRSCRTRGSPASHSTARSELMVFLI